MKEEHFFFTIFIDIQTVVKLAHCSMLASFINVARDYLFLQFADTNLGSVKEISGVNLVRRPCQIASWKRNCSLFIISSRMEAVLKAFNSLTSLTFIIIRNATLPLIMLQTKNLPSFFAFSRFNRKFLFIFCSFHSHFIIYCLRVDRWSSNLLGK